MAPRSDRLHQATAQRGRMWVRVLVGAVVVLAVVLAGALVALSLVDWNKHAATLAAKIKEETGRELRTAGPIEIGVLPPRLIAESVSFGNAPWGSRPEMIKARRVEMRVALMPLLVGNVHLRVDLVEPDVLLERNAKGEPNWMVVRTRAAPERDASGKKDASPVEFDRVRITKASFTYRDARTGKTRRLLVDQGLVRPKGLSGREITLKATLEGLPLELAAITDQPPLRALSRGETLGMQVEAKTSGTRLRATGRIGLPQSGLAAELEVAAEIADTQPIAKIAGAKLPPLPPLKLTGRVSAANKVYKGEKLAATLGKSSATGRLAADLAGARPRLTGEVAAPLVDLTELRRPRGAQSAAGGPSGGRDERVFSRESLPIQALNAFDADVGVRVARLVVTPELLAEDVQGRLALDRGRLVVQPLAMRIGGGDAKLVGSLDTAGGRSATLDATLAGSGIELGRMMAALGRGDDLSGGRTEVSASLRARGVSMAALAGAADGHARIVVRSARVKGGALDRLGGDAFVQLANALNPTRKTDPYTDVQCAVVNIPIRDGVVVVDRTVAVETPKVGASMAGTVNLGTEQIDLSIRPQAKEGIGVGIGNLASMVKIEGTLKQPTVGVDMKGAAGAAAQVGLGVVTGGLSILAKGLFDQATMDAPCQTALRSGAAAPGTAAPAGGKPAAKSDKPSSGGIGGFFDRLLK